MSFAAATDDDEKRKLENLQRLKEQLKANLETIGLRKFCEKIKQFRAFRANLSSEIMAALKSGAIIDTANIIPVPDSLQQNVAKLRAQPLSVLRILELNPNLMCQGLARIPSLIPNCREPSIPTNVTIVELINKVMPHLIELEHDLNLLNFALQLSMPRMREGKFLGIDLLKEVIVRVQEFRASTRKKIRSLSNYHRSRHDLLQNIISYAHIEAHRFALARFDRRYCHMLSTSVEFVYKTLVIVYDLIKRNADKLSEFGKIAVNDFSEFDATFYS